MTTSNTSVNVPVSTNSIQLNPHDYINKGINEIITEYLSLISPDKKRTIRTLFFGVTMLMAADISKNIIQNFVRENSQHINGVIMSGFRLISLENLCYVSNYVYGGIQSTFHGFVGLFRRNPPSHAHLCNPEENDDPASRYVKMSLMVTNDYLKKIIHVLVFLGLVIHIPQQGEVLFYDVF